MTSQNRSGQTGFTLVELAMVMVIIGILTVGSLSIFTVQREQVRYSDSEQRLAQIKLGLLSFVNVNQFLPCPDTDADGFENRAGNGSCSAIIGTVPYLDLGLRQVEALDGFGYSILYQINSQANNLASIQDSVQSASYFCNATCAGAALPVFDINTPPSSANSGVGNYQVCAKAAVNCSAASLMDYDAISVVLVAANQGGNLACNNRPAKPQENCDGDGLFWQGNFRDSSGEPFDDVVLGISGYDIKKELLNSRPDVLIP